MSDEDLWSQYAQGVKKLSSKKVEQKKNILKVDALPVEASVVTEPEKPKSAFEQMIDGTPSALIPKIEAIAETPSVVVPEKKLTPRVLKSEPLDVRIERNLSLGDVVIEAKIDLHGKTEEEAHRLFLGFVEKQETLNRRMLLIITGRGKDGQSVLRKNLPRWCEVPPISDKIIALRTAAAHHGGDGAYYLLLRKK